MKIVARIVSWNIWITASVFDIVLLMEWYIRITETGLVPDFLVRIGIRRLLKQTLREVHSMDIEEEGEYLMRLVRKFSAGPIALSVERANEQHYELPPEFFRRFLGRRMKYSSGYWSGDHSLRLGRERKRNKLTAGLDEAEAAMLELTSRRAEVGDGQRILDLGCGWGAVSLYLAQAYPHARITAVSGSRYQIDYIREQAREQGYTNLEAIACDINDFQPKDRFDRIISVEMFEHMKNYRELLQRICSWLEPGGKLFVHLFSHHRYCYEYPDTGSWMARTFFTGGTMPSDYLLLYFHSGLTLEGHWRVSGDHYRKTLRAWLDRYDRNRRHIMPILESAYGTKEAKRWFIYWRLFLMACEETFGLRDGNEYLVSHYLFEKPVSSKC
jgi:cyclopropane-fatty-acyl-phospholipid synthase